MELSEITKLTKASDIAENLSLFLNDRVMLTKTETNVINSLIAKVNKARVSTKGIDEQMARIAAESPIEGLDQLAFTQDAQGLSEAEKESEGLKGGSAHVPLQPSSVEKILLKTKFSFTTSRVPVYDFGSLDAFCNRTDVNYDSAMLQTLINAMAEVAFQGFKWADVFAKLRSRAKSAELTKEMFIYHMRLLCSIYIERGSAYFHKGLKGLKNSELQAYIRAMIKCYDIVIIRPKTGYTSDDVTITRVVAIFPDLVARIIRETQKTPIANDVSPALKSWYKFPGGASLIPKDMPEMFATWLVWYKAFGVIINQNNPVKQTEEQVVRYANAIWNSTVVSPGVKSQVLTWTDPSPKV